MKTIAMINESAGSGRTELTKMLATWLQRRAQARVLLIDLSPFVGANLSSHFLTKAQIKSSRATIIGALVDTHTYPLPLGEGLDLFVGNDYLHRADQRLTYQPTQNRILQQFFEVWDRSPMYDYALIDGNASFDLLTQSAIIAADCVLAPRGVRRSVADMAERSLPSTFEAVHAFRTELLTEEHSFSVALPLDELTEHDWADLADHVATCLN